MEDILKLSEKVRLHLDWWGKCRTCKYWDGDRTILSFGNCSCKDSQFYAHKDKYIASPICTYQDTICEKWCSFDIEAAEIVIEYDKNDSIRESPDIDLFKKGL